MLDRYQRRTTRLARQVKAEIKELAPPPEGVNTKTKRIARQMHGRAGFTLLRHGILLG